MAWPSPGEGGVKVDRYQGFLFNPAEIIRQLDLRRPIYRASTHYGHFGKKGLPWEVTSKMAAFHKALSK